MLYYSSSSNKVVPDVGNELGRAPARCIFTPFYFRYQPVSKTSVCAGGLHASDSTPVCNDIHTLCMCNYMHTTHTRRAFVRNLLVVGFPSAMVLRPDLFFAASLDSRRDILLDEALHTFPFLRHLGVRY